MIPGIIYVKTFSTDVDVIITSIMMSHQAVITRDTMLMTFNMLMSLSLVSGITAVIPGIIYVKTFSTDVDVIITSISDQDNDTSTSVLNVLT